MEALGYHGKNLGSLGFSKVTTCDLQASRGISLRVVYD